MATPERDPITCHILDTSLGRPAVNVPVSLECLSSSTPSTSATQSSAPKVSWIARTDQDGRIKTWKCVSTTNWDPSVVDVLQGAHSKGQETSRWLLTFDTGEYYGGADKTFFPEVRVVISVKQGQHYHVPLLLAPYSYSTYRGS